MPAELLNDAREEGALSRRVLDSPEGGCGVFFAPIASGQPLALVGFGFALGMLSLINAEIVSLNALGFMIAVALSIGSLALIIGGIVDFRGNNLFGGTWALAYGCFWISAGLILLVVGPQVTEQAGAAGFADAFGAYLLIWAVFTGYMTVAAYHVAGPAFLAFLLLTLVFVLLGLSNTSAPGDLSDTLRTVGGYAGIITALLAWYLAAALTINTTAGRDVLPIWPYPYR